MFNKKGQPTTQLFVYILAIVVIGLLLVLGVKYIGQIVTKVEEVDLLQFKTELESDAQKMKSAYGSWQKYEYNVPEGIDKICFLESFDQNYLNQGGNVCDASSDDYDFLICDAWQDGSGGNVFASPMSAKIKTAIDIGEIETGVDMSYVCFDVVASKVKIKMTGLGDKVKIEGY